ncbi:glutathione S-transferase family protein [Paraburkholderia sp. D1E]|uniref:glutathione S-transferase family protein n=1 Tax=Paraburkholderia sp. D1E TaxID=3461398 RepID=UPI004045AFF3
MLTLHHSPFSVASQKVRLALAEKQLDWDDRLVDLLAGQHLQEDFLRLNPRAEVPVLEHDGHVLNESWFICEYLEEAFLQHPLMPAAPVHRYAARQWNHWIERELHHASGVVTYAVLARPLLLQQPPEVVEALLKAIPDASVRAWRASVLEHGLDAPQLKESISRHHAFVRRMETQLVDAHGWLAGPACSLADLAALPYVMRADHVGLGSLMTFEESPNLRSWYLRMLSRPSMQASFVRYVDADLQSLMTQLVVAAHPKLEQLIQTSD